MIKISHSAILIPKVLYSFTAVSYITILIDCIILQLNLLTSQEIYKNHIIFGVSIPKSFKLFSIVICVALTNVSLKFFKSLFSAFNTGHE